MKGFVKSKTVCTLESTATMVAESFPVTLCLYHALPYIYPDRSRIMTINCQHF